MSKTLARGSINPPLYYGGGMILLVRPKYLKDVVAVQNSVKWLTFCVIKQELYLSLFAYLFFYIDNFTLLRLVETFDNVYHFVQILVEQSLVTERTLSLYMYLKVIY